VAKVKTRSILRDNAVVSYLRETRSELRKVHWPTREEAWNLTKIVLAVTAIMALLLGVLDYLFAIELAGLISGNVIAVAALAVVAIAAAVATVLINRQTNR
jgi:preprotein translocase subunit SecE